MAMSSAYLPSEASSGSAFSFDLFVPGLGNWEIDLGWS